MKDFIRKIFPFVLAPLIGCAGSPVAPSPPLEIPSVVTFPESVEVDLASVSNSGAGDAVLKFLEGPVGEFSDIITIGPSEFRTVNDEVLEGFLLPFTAFEIPVSPSMTQFNAIRQSLDEVPQEYKFDFSQFDFDGDGTVDGIGCTCPVGCSIAACPSEAPRTDLKQVCFRIWIKKDPVEPFTRIMAGCFDILPVRDDPNTPTDEENPGKGSFRGGVILGGDVGGSLGAERFLVGVSYDHRDPEFPLNKATEVFALNDLTFPDGTKAYTLTAHLQATQTSRQDASGSHYLEYTVKSADDAKGMTDFGIEFDFFKQYLGRFRSDADFWSGSFFLLDNGMETSVPTTCARISTGSGVSSDICTDLDIDTAGESFLGFALEADVLFPEDFPLLPTF